MCACVLPKQAYLCMCGDTYMTSVYFRFLYFGHLYNGRILYAVHAMYVVECAFVSMLSYVAYGISLMRCCAFPLRVPMKLHPYS